MSETVKRLNAAKKAKGYTLKRLAEESGLTLGTVNKIMSGELQKINPEKLAKLATALNVSVEYLQGGAPDNITNKGGNYLGLVKVACISPNVRVGDCDYNTEKIIEATKRANRDGVKIALFPELCITGYTCGDLFFQKTLRDSALNNLNKLRVELSDTDTVCIVGLPLTDDAGKLYNTAAVVYRSEILGVVPKVNLPNYNEFIEKRLFNNFDGNDRTVNLFGKATPFASKIIFANSLHPEIRFALEICEDVWVSDSPSVRHSEAGANAIFNLSASNETVGKSSYRRKMIEIQSATCGVIYAYCSSAPSESTSQTVFSAHNIICENGELLDESKPFGNAYAEAYVDFGYIANERARLDRSSVPDDYQTVFFELPVNGGERIYSASPFVPQDKRERDNVCETALTILAHGLKKRVEHVKADNLVLGVSGGSDSSLALIICERALRLLNRSPKDITAITMPCFGTSERTLDNSIALATAMGATVRKIDISPAVAQHLKDINHPLNKTDVTYENAQARERTQVLMDVANDCNGLVVGTGDMSELALGWATYNGDHMSMYAANASVPKTLVKAILHYVADNAKGELKRVLRDIIDTPVSPELLPPSKENDITQVTEDIVGPYELHDYFLFMLIRKGFTPSKTYRMAQLSFAGRYDDETVYKWLKTFIRRFFTQQFKRSCAPDSVKLGSVDISKLGLRMPGDACCDAWLADLETVSPIKQVTVCE
ncbi:MAG: NAD(+) synthase [Corallococcus sp.]|nr:NAD(+) synthase [Bacillota bacterium]MCM1533681.1 NAD(+) synthase [Corallococcus sp.]